MNNAEKLDVQTNESDDEYLTFNLSGEEFAVPIMNVKEILEYRSLTVVPMVPGYIEGAINLRGSVVPVIGLACKFGLPVSATTRRTCIVIIEVEMDGESTVLGVIVDKVLQVINIHEHNIEVAPEFGAKIRADFIQGMGKVDGRFLIILDSDRVLSLEEIAVSAGAKSEQTGSVMTD